MRRLIDGPRLRQFMRELGRQATGPTVIYLTGGATAVLEGWRQATIDIDLKLDPERDELLRAMPELKERLEINIELASPADFIPTPAGWELRSAFVGMEGQVAFYNFDPYSQALSKLERGHEKDLTDVRELVLRGLVEPSQLRRMFEAIEPELYRFPALDRTSFRRAVWEFTEGFLG